MLDRQAAFDTMLAHLRKQGKRATNPGGTSCRYRTSDGLKCAVGALIPDHLYYDRLEYNSLGYEHLAVIPGGAEPEDLTFLLKAQRQLHDGIPPYSYYDFHVELERAALCFADEFNLTYTAPTCTPAS